MEITIEKIDELIERTGVSYSQAKKALMETEGDLLEAILLIENGPEDKKSSQEKESFDSSEESSNERANKTKNESDLQKNIGEFMQISIAISKGNKKMMNLPLWLAILFAILASELIVPILIIGLLLSLFGKFQFKIKK